MKTTTRKRPPIVYILGLAILVRCLAVLAWLLLSGELAALHYPDTATYLAPAQSLLERGAFERNSSPEIIRGPGYPLLLTVGLAAGQVEAATVAMQILLSVATVYLLYRCSLMLVEPRFALFAAALYAVEPLSVVYCCLLLTETLYTFLLAGFLFAFLHFLKHDSPRSLFAAALLLTASAFVRPVSYYLPLVTSGVLILAVPRGRGWSRPVRLATGFLLVCAIPLGAWQVRNWQLADYPGFSAIVPSDLYFYQQAAVTASLEGRPVQEVQEEMGMLDPAGPLKQHPEWKGLSEGELHVRMGAQAKRVILAHPLVYAENHLRNIFRLLITPGSADVMRLTNHFGTAPAGYQPDKIGAVGSVADGGRGRIVTALALSGIAVSYLLLAGLGCLQRIPPRMRWTLVTFAAYFWLVSCLPQAPARLRHPLMPILCLLAAHGAAALVARVQKRTQREGHESIASIVRQPNTRPRPSRALDAA